MRESVIVAPSTGEICWLSTKEASSILGIALQSLYRFIDAGELPAYKFGRVIRIKQGDVDAFIEARRIAPGELGHLYQPLLDQGHKRGGEGT